MVLSREFQHKTINGGTQTYSACDLVTHHRCFACPSWFHHFTEFQPPKKKKVKKKKKKKKVHSAPIQFEFEGINVCFPFLFEIILAVFAV